MTSGTHDAVVGERDQLRKDIRLAQNRSELLTASNESLSSERVELIEQVELLRTQRLELEAGVAELTATSEALAADLARSETALAARAGEVDSLRETYDGLVKDLQTEVAAGRIEIDQLREGLRVKLSQEVLFSSGSVSLSPAGEGVLAAVASRLADVAQGVEVAGHTDDVPIRGGLATRYPTNWELSSARASRVVRVLQANGVAADRLVAVGYADTQPAASNDTAEGRAKNRRIEIRLRPFGEGAGGPPASPEAPASAVPEAPAPADEAAPPPEGQGSAPPA